MTLAQFAIGAAAAGIAIGVAYFAVLFTSAVIEDIGDILSEEWPNE